MHLDIDKLRAVDGKPLYCMDRIPTSVEGLLDTLSADGFLILRISNARTKADFMDRATEVFLLPSYFGRNWDALHECLSDLTWLPAEGYILILSTDDLLRTSPDDLKSAVEVLLHVNRSWRQDGIRFCALLVGSKDVSQWLSANFSQDLFEVASRDSK